MPNAKAVPASKSSFGKHLNHKIYMHHHSHKHGHHRHQHPGHHDSRPQRNRYVWYIEIPAILIAMVALLALVILFSVCVIDIGKEAKSLVTNFGCSDNKNLTSGVESLRTGMVGVSEDTQGSQACQGTAYAPWYSRGSIRPGQFTLERSAPAAVVNPVSPGTEAFLDNHRPSSSKSGLKVKDPSRSTHVHRHLQEVYFLRMHGTTPIPRKVWVIDSKAGETLDRSGK